MVVALVPIRHHSQRVPGKNYRKLGDRPLYQYIIDTLLQVDRIDMIVIDTDSPIITQGINKIYDSNQKVQILPRAPSLCGDSISMNQIIYSVLTQLDENKQIDESTIILQTHVTNPFLTTDTINRAITQFFESSSSETTLMSVTRYQKRLWHPDQRPVNHVPGKLIQTQDLPKLYEENSNLYLFTAGNMFKRFNRLGKYLEFIEMDYLEAWDIDTEQDFNFAKIILQQQQNNIQQNEQSEQKIIQPISTTKINLELLQTLNQILAPEITRYQDNKKSSSHTVLISAPYMMPEIDTFRAFFNQQKIEVIVAKVNERLTEEDLIQYHGQYQVAMTGDDAYTANILKDSGVKAICKWGTGIDSIDLEYCEQHGIKVLNTPNAFSVPVSQSIMAAIFGFLRQTFQSNQLMKISSSSVSTKWVKLPGLTLEESTIGIVGLGNIGQRLARYLIPFGPQIIGYDILPGVKSPSEVKITTDLSTLLGQSDIICLCCTLNPTSYHLINQQTLSQIKSGSYLINMARGHLIDEPALIRSIEAGHLGGVALDVFEDEPLPGDSPLRRLPNVIISSHNSNSSVKYWEKVHLNTIRNCLMSLIDLN